ncbi:hypothetical protein PUNSTDRAFT_129935 [Punctularia strigosozonata HHB-11173 SS5]|uniref:uncharacterized protein n=1 Tax=Punctularia strigosozonata (strain HHB-11173) TaxID=741275 RepID=UPI00044172C9|nr:uncharacterized protein PUNSTDRAFT_129935 [Punctularia strigosozonata HHB-11173 SS5]EIN14299.1 hypothetical protein PUNSTDRAFT_129935 [Punctularia strigosozonata HHB-11173 SS5]
METLKPLAQVLPALPVKGREMLYVAAHPAMLALVLMFAIIDLGLSISLVGVYTSDPDRMPSEDTLDVIRPIMWTSLCTLLSNLIYLTYYKGNSLGIPRISQRAVFAANVCS